jgi:cytochrome c
MQNASGQSAATRRAYDCHRMVSRIDVMKFPLCTALLTVLTIATAQAQTPAPDLAAGEASFRKCFACHAVGPDAKNKVGPHLNGLDGRKAGTQEGYSFSAANKDSGIVWNEAEFKDYIRNPRAKIPKTKMIFAGIKSENEINNLWAYLAQFNADGSKK